MRSKESHAMIWWYDASPPAFFFLLTRQQRKYIPVEILARLTSDTFRTTLARASGDAETLSEVKWRELVFSKFLEPLEQEFKSNGCVAWELQCNHSHQCRDVVFDLLTPKKQPHNKQDAYKPDSMHAQKYAHMCMRTVSYTAADTRTNLPKNFWHAFVT